MTCHPNDSLGAVFSLIKIRRVHRLVVVTGSDDPRPGRLVGVISLSDIMRHLIVSLGKQVLLTAERDWRCSREDGTA